MHTHTHDERFRFRMRLPGQSKPGRALRIHAIVIAGGVTPSAAGAGPRRRAGARRAGSALA